jgi:nucleoside-diphosphate-sugar epimerase
MRVLVVAGTGFLGGHAARAFVERGHRVTALVRDEMRAARDPRLEGALLVRGRAGALPQLEPHDVVVYAAGAWVRDDPASADEIARRCREVYVDGVRSLAERARAWSAHFVFMSGTSRFGDREGVLSEESAPGPLSIYGAHKRKSEAILADTEGLRWTAIVPPEVYGAYDASGYARFVQQRIASRRFVLLGDGENRWSLCNVRNVADAMVQIAPGPGLGPLLVADAVPTSQRELASTIARAMGRSALFPRVPRAIALAAAAVNARIPRAGPRFSPAHVRARTRDFLLDTSRARNLGVVPRHDLASGIEEAIAWWRDQERARVGAR